jgi:hypothetical protein
MEDLRNFKIIFYYISYSENMKKYIKYIEHCIRYYIFQILEFFILFINVIYNTLVY